MLKLIKHSVDFCFFFFLLFFSRVRTFRFHAMVRISQVQVLALPSTCVGRTRSSCKARNRRRKEPRAAASLEQINQRSPNRDSKLSAVVVVHPCDALPAFRPVITRCNNPVTRGSLTFALWQQGVMFLTPIRRGR